MICSIYKTVDATEMASSDKCIRGSEVNNGVIVKDTSYSDAATFKTAMSGVQLCYELSTPTTVQLTPALLTLLKGYNYITADGVIEFDYVPESIIDEAETILVPISILGTNESGRTTASRAYTNGEYFYKDGKMYFVLTSIAMGAAFTVGTNCVETDLFTELKAAMNNH